MAADMKEILKPDNKVAVILTKICDLAILNILWLLTGIFVVTIGPSTVALYTVIEKMRSDTVQGIAKTYFKAFRENLKTGMCLSLVFWLFFGILSADMYLLHRASGGAGAVMYGVCAALIVFGIMVFVYTFELASVFENTVKGYFIAAFKLTICNLPLSILVLAVNIFIPVLFVTAPGVISRFVVFILIFGGSSVAYVSSYLLGGVMEELKVKS